MNEEIPFGYETARRVVLKMGRKKFFGSALTNLPQNRAPEIAQNDLLPQFGFVGEQYTAKRVLLLGINPANGDNDKQNSGDEAMMPLLKKFVEEPTPDNFRQAQQAYQKVCVDWVFWKNSVGKILKDSGLHLNEIAYSNCLPWRTKEPATFDDEVAENAALFFAYPLIQELEPYLVVAVGKKAADILRNNGRPISNLVEWNLAQQATSAVKEKRQKAIQEITQLLQLLGS